jgi:hypothetical protein
VEFICSNPWTGFFRIFTEKNIQNFLYFRTKFSATAPVRFDEKPPFPRKSVDTENMFLDGSKTWTPGQERTEPEKVSFRL